MNNADMAKQIVEPAAGNFMLINRMLFNAGIKVEWKTSGYEVVEFAENLPALDLILMDIRLPYEDGYAAFRKLRANDKFKQNREIGGFRWLYRQTA